MSAEGPLPWQLNVARRLSVTNVHSAANGGGVTCDGSSSGASRKLSTADGDDGVLRILEKMLSVVSPTSPPE